MSGGWPRAGGQGRHPPHLLLPGHNLLPKGVDPLADGSELSAALLHPLQRLLVHAIPRLDRLDLLVNDLLQLGLNALLDAIHHDFDLLSVGIGLLVPGVLEAAAEQGRGKRERVSGAEPRRRLATKDANTNLNAYETTYVALRLAQTLVMVLRTALASWVYVETLAEGIALH